MIVNLEIDLFPGNTVYQYFFKDGEFVENSKVLLMEELSQSDVTFVQDDSVYCHKRFKVKYPDGFVTNRDIYYLVSDNTENLTDEYLEKYTFNFEQEFPDTEYCIDMLGNTHQPPQQRIKK